MGTKGVPDADKLRDLAPKVQCPVRLLVQWDDEIISLDGCLELITPIGSKKKTLPGNPGVHQAVLASRIPGSRVSNRLLHLPCNQGIEPAVRQYPVHEVG